MAPFRREPDERLLGLLEESGRNVQRTALLLAICWRTIPTRNTGQDLRLLSRRRSDHARLHPPLNGPPRQALRCGRGYRLATPWTTSSITPSRLATARALRRRSHMSQRSIWRRSGGCLRAGCHALRCLRTGTGLSHNLVEIHRLENEATGFAAMPCLPVRQRYDPMVVIRWRDIFESLERQSMPADGAHALEESRCATTGRVRSCPKEAACRCQCVELPAVRTASVEITVGMRLRNRRSARRARSSASRRA